MSSLLFTTYAELQTSIAEELNRDDLTDQIPGFIVLAEAKMKRKLRRTATVDTLSIVSGDSSVALPVDLAELRAIAQVVGGATPRGVPALKVGSFEWLQELRPQFSTTGRPQFGAVVNQTLYVVPAPTDSYLDFTISYFTKLVPLSGSNATNDVLDEAPDAYFYGALMHASPYLEHDERVPLWRELFETAIDDLNEMRQREEFGANLKAARLPVVIG